MGASVEIMVATVDGFEVFATRSAFGAPEGVSSDALDPDPFFDPAFCSFSQPTA
jgi:hypothetical protein